MTEKQFMNEVANRLLDLEQTRGMDIQCQTLMKNNDTKRHGIILQQKDNMVSPTIFLDRYYQQYLHEQISVEEVADCIVHILEKVKDDSKKFSSLSLNYEDCKDKIIYRLISKTKNVSIRDKIPFIPFLDLMITFYIVIGYTETGVETLKITNELMSDWNMTTADLFRLAEENTPSIFPARVESMTQMLERYLKMPEDKFVDLPMIVIGNEAGVYGASTLLYPHIVEDLAEKIDSDFYALPSSVHEFIIVPGKDETSLNEYSELVKHINENYVDREEILSDHAYYYDRKEKKFIM